MKNFDIKILCDTCNSDLSPCPTNYPHNFILRVTVEDVAMHSESGVIYDIMMYPPLKNDLYFCGIGCMKSYDPKK